MLFELILLKGAPYTGVLVAVASLQWILRKVDRWWAAIPISSLMLIPGWWGVVGSYEMVLGGIPPFERWQLAYLMVRDPWTGNVLVLLVYSIPSWVLWVMISRAPCRNLAGEPCRGIPVARAYGVILAVMAIGFMCLNQYRSLQYAVETNDVSLAARRLECNLFGVGPNDGSITDNGSGGLSKGPLLPTAVGNANKAMVELLIQYGAELNPELPVEIHRPDVYMENALAVAIRHDNLEMVTYLIERGTDPTQGLFQAVFSGRLEIFRFLVLHGADTQIAREQLRRVDALYSINGAALVDPLEGKLDQLLQAPSDEPFSH